MPKSKAFAFSLGQRVNVPGKKNVQGLVTLPSYFNDFQRTPVFVFDDRHRPHFFLRWLADDSTWDCGWFSEADLIAANGDSESPITVEALTAAITDNPARDTESDRSLRGSRQRLRPARKAPARKTKSRRK